MNDVAKHTLVLLRRVAELFEELPEDQITDLVEGRARLSYIPWGATEPVPPPAPPATATARKRASAPKTSKATIDVPAICAALEAATSREEGRSLLRALPHTDDVRAVAVGLGMTVAAKATKTTLIEQIVDLTIGGRLSSAAIRVI